jgi:hypothetical protein
MSGKARFDNRSWARRVGRWLMLSLAAGVLSLPIGAIAQTSIGLGLNTAAWDGQYTGSGVAAINGFLMQAHIGVLRYPGGSWADEYDWSQNTDIYGCLNPGGSNACPESDSIDFDTFAQDASQAGAATFVTVNYGSGSPALAAAWVGHARTNPGEQVALWEVGNESYGCWEVNNWLAGYPAYVSGYKPNSTVCPDTQTMANSYAANALAFLLAMKKADPNAKLGVPWAFEPSQASGAGVTNASQWNDTVLGQDGAYVDFVDAHWYPFSDVSGLTDSQIVASIGGIPDAMLGIRATLRKHHLDSAVVVVGETNISNQETTLVFQPVAALFAAGNALEWLSQGAVSVDWWDMNNYGSPQTGDYGMFSSSPPPGNAPLPAYYGYWLASLLTRMGEVSTLDMASSSVFGFQSVGENRRAVLLINANTAQSATVRVNGFREPTTLQTWTYTATSAALANPILQGILTSQQLRGGLLLPPESVVVLSDTGH